MSSVSATSSILSSLISSLSSGSTTTSTSATTGTDSTSTISDIVDILSGSSDSISSILADDSDSDSSDSMYGILLSSANASLMKSNPSLIEALASAVGDSSNGGSSSTLEEVLGINLVTISSEDLLSLLQADTEGS